MNKLDYSYDADKDLMTIEGQRYTGHLFRQFAATGGLVTGTLFEFTRQPDGAFAIRKVWEPGQEKQKA